MHISSFPLHPKLIPSRTADEEGAERKEQNKIKAVMHTIHQLYVYDHDFCEPETIQYGRCAMCDV